MNLGTYLICEQKINKIMNFEEIVSKYIDKKGKRYFLVKILKDLVSEYNYEHIPIGHLNIIEEERHKISTIFQYVFSDMIYLKSDDKIIYDIDVLSDEEYISIIEYLYSQSGQKKDVEDEIMTDVPWWK